MPVEQRPEIISFIHTWKDKPREQVVEELASYSLETKRIPDPYYFLIDSDVDLFSPSAGNKVKKFISRETLVGKLEGQAFDVISSWFRDHTSGAIAWISPPYPGIYPTSKIIISEIEIVDGLKRLFNRAVVLDMDGSECLELARGLTQYSKNHPLMTHLDEVRANPLILNTQGRHWTYIFEEFIDEPLVWKGIRRGDEQRAKKEALIQAQIVFGALFGGTAGLAEAKIMMFEMLGDKPGSCPPILFTGTAFRVFSENSLAIGGLSKSKDPDFCRNCPVCGEVINCIVRVGGSCPECGAVKRCG